MSSKTHIYYPTDIGRLFWLASRERNGFADVGLSVSATYCVAFYKDIPVNEVNISDVTVLLTETLDHYYNHLISQNFPVDDISIDVESVLIESTSGVLNENLISRLIISAGMELLAGQPLLSSNLIVNLDGPDDDVFEIWQLVVSGLYFNQPEVHQDLTEKKTAKIYKLFPNK
ncbi:hypothetical protein [Methylomonas sp. AM2-LC]|uniref:hypothetical protein n=1 Tax=Methylomonas sp. AM2-LC TaxID=3153301 RepID=UPI00326387BF